MCGIIGYRRCDGGDPVIDVLMNGLDRLEYRGYDSAGVAVADTDVSVRKREGELVELERAIDGQPPEGHLGVGHTRWSTHGPPSDENAHPHRDCTGEVAVVHNGIIENYRALREELQAAGHRFHSDTDTEVIPHLIEEARMHGECPGEAFREAVEQLEGSYAIVAIIGENPDRMWGAREESPLLVGLGDAGTYLASDVPAFIDYTDRVMYLEDGEIVAVDERGPTIMDTDGDPIDDREIARIDWDPEDAGKSGYEHYMLKEIHEQPAAIRQCLRNRVQEFSGRIELPELHDVTIGGGGVHFVACGTSYHAALFGARLLQEQGVDAQCFLASEYDPEVLPIGRDRTVIGVTQSGETADTLGALRAANRDGASTLAVTNVMQSSAVRESDHVMYIRAGPEIGVAATKTFVSQVVALSLLAGELTGSATEETVRNLRRLPDLVQRVLDNSTAREVATGYQDAEAFFFIGRHWNYPVTLEGALKMKEITYKHAEGFAGGELKHGPLALVTEDTPIFATVTEGCVPEKMLGNVKEVEARDAPVIAVTDMPERLRHYADEILEIPSAGERITPLLANVQLQLAAYWVANELGRSIDKPRNLAKSVTVE